MEENEKDGAISPFQTLEDQVQLLEAEMEMVRQQFHDEEETWERSAKALAKENRSSIIEDIPGLENDDALIQEQMQNDDGSVNMLEDHLQLLEAEMKMIHQQFHDEEEEWQRSAKEPARETRSSTIEDVTVLENDGASMQIQTKADGDSIHILSADLPRSEATISITRDTSAQMKNHDHAIQQTTRSTKNDVRNLASMFENKLSPANLPRPPPPPPPPASIQLPVSTPTSIKKGKSIGNVISQRLQSPSSGSAANGLTNQRQRNASLSIKEGKALFERASSPPGASDTLGTTRSKIQVKPKANVTIASPSSRSKDKSNEVVPIPVTKDPNKTGGTSASLKRANTNASIVMNLTTDCVSPSHSLRDRTSTVDKRITNTATNLQGVDDLVDMHRGNKNSVKKQTEANDGTSSPIKEGTSLFEAVVSPPSVSDSSKSIPSNTQAKSNAMMTSPSSQHEGQSAEVISKKKLPGETEEDGGILSKPKEKCFETKLSPGIKLATNVVAPPPTIDYEAPLYSLKDRISMIEKGRITATTSFQGLGSPTTSEISANSFACQRQADSDDGASLSIKEGKYLFERAFSPPRTSGPSRNIPFKIRAKSIATMSIPSSRNRGKIDEVISTNKFSDIISTKKDLDGPEAERATTSSEDKKSCTATKLAPLPSLKDRISMIEKSKSIKLPFPPVRRTKSVDSVVHSIISNSPAPETEPHVSPLSKPKQSNDGRKLGRANTNAQHSIDKRNKPTIPTEGQIAVSPSTLMPSMPVRSKEIPTLTGSKENTCSTDIIKQRRAALIQGLKLHLNENSTNCRDEANEGTNVTNVNPHGIVSSSGLATSSSPGETNIKNKTAKEHIRHAHTPSQKISPALLGGEAKHDTTASVHTREVEVEHGKGSMFLGEGICIAKKLSTNDSTAPLPSLRERISMVERSNSMKSPSPPMRRIEPVDSIVRLVAGNSLSPEPTPRISPPSETNEPNRREDGNGGAQHMETSTKLPMSPNEKVMVSPSMPFTPIRPKEFLVLSGNNDEAIASSMCSDDIIKQRRAALVQGLKLKLHSNEKSMICSDKVDEVPGVSHVSSREIVYSTDAYILSSPLLVKPNAISAKVSRGEVTEHHVTVHRSQKESGQTDVFLDDTIWQRSNIQQSDMNDVKSSPSASGSFATTDTREATRPNTTNTNSNISRGRQLDKGPSPCELEEGLFDEETMQPDTDEVHPSSQEDSTPSAQRKTLVEEIISCISQLCKRSRSCITVVLRKGNMVVKMLRFFLQPCLTILWGHFSLLFIFCWLKISLLRNAAKEMINGTSALGHFYIRECLDNYSVIISLAPSALKTVGSWAATIDRGVAWCFASITVTMFADMYPTVPSCNIFIALLLLFFRINVKLVDRSQYHSILLIVVVAISLCIDVDWMSYKYFPTALDEESSLAYRIQQETSLVWIISWYSLLINSFLKGICLNVYLKSSNHGRNIKKMLWERGGKCFIPSRIPEDLGAAVRDKAIALSWIEIVCSLLYFSYFFVIEFDVVSSTLFRDFPNQILSLQGSLLVKAASGFIVFLSLAHHIRVRDFVGLFWCNSVCPALDDSHSSTSRGPGRILSRMEKSFRCIIFVKALDFTAGVILWTSLVSVHRQTGFDAPKDVTTLLGMIFATQMFTSTIAPIQGAVVFWYIRISTRDLGIIGQRTTTATETAPVSNSSNSSSRRRRRNRKRHFVPTTRKRSNRKHSSKSMLRTGFLDEEFSSSSVSNYDLKNPSSSQNLFETRLTSAVKARIPSTPTKSDELDLNVTCSPHQFQAEWQDLKKGFTLEQDCFKKEIPILSDCHKHFHARRFYVVGSGVVGNQSRILIIAQRRVDTPVDIPSSSYRKKLSRCLAEITFNSNSYEMKAEIRCRNEDEIRFFLSVLELKQLFGELS